MTRRITVVRVDICELCQQTYEPEETSDLRRLKVFQGYTVDLRLQQFRRMEYGKLPQFIEFASPKGKKLLDLMHKEVTR